MIRSISTTPFEDRRIQARLPVWVGRSEKVRYYTSNVSKVGLFVEGLPASDLARRPRVEVELPGSGSFEVSCQVVHVVDQERARNCGLRRGIGLLVLAADEQYFEAMNSYLFSLHSESVR